MRHIIPTFFYMLLFVGLIYFAVWPIPIMPIEWEAPPNPGFTGVYSPNDKLKGLQRLSVKGHIGPEAVAFDDQGRIYTGTANGLIIRLDRNGENPEVFADTKGRPLGMEIDQDGNLIVADGKRGLISIEPNGAVDVLADHVIGRAIGFADDLAIGPNNKIYFTDASKKFWPGRFGSSSDAAVLDLVEHGGNGRLLVYDTLTQETDRLVNDVDFANGVTLSHDRKAIIFSEMGSYRILRYWIDGPREGELEILVDQLPAFPDNITTGTDGRYWVAMVSPRNKLMDMLSGWPRIRKMIMRLPKQLHPAAVRHSHVIAINDDGEIVANLQDSDASYTAITSVIERDGVLYFGSLTMKELARLEMSQAGL